MERVENQIKNRIENQLEIKTELTKDINYYLSKVSDYTYNAKLIKHEILCIRENKNVNDAIFDNLLVDFALNLDNTLAILNNNVDSNNENIEKFLNALKVVNIKTMTNTQVKMILEIFIKINVLQTNETIETTTKEETTLELKFITNIVERFVNTDMDTKINVLAFLSHKILQYKYNAVDVTYYPFEYDIYVFMEILFIEKTYDEVMNILRENFTGEIKNQRSLFQNMQPNPIVSSLLLNWSKTKQSKFKLVMDTEHIFCDIIKYMGDTELLYEILYNKKNINYVYMKIEYLLKYMNEDVVVDLIINCNDNQLVLKIFNKIKNIELLCKYVKNTKNTLLYKHIYESINLQHVRELNVIQFECILINIDHIEMLKDEILIYLYEGKYEKYLKKCTQKIMRILHENDKLENILVHMLKNDDKNNLYDNILFLLNISQLQYEEDIKNIFDKNINQNDKVVEIYFKLKDIELVRKVYKTNKLTMTEELKKQLNTKNIELPFYINTAMAINYKIDEKIIKHLKLSMEDYYYMFNGNININISSKEYTVVINDIKECKNVEICGTKIEIAKNITTSQQTKNVVIKYKNRKLYINNIEQIVKDETQKISQIEISGTLIFKEMVVYECAEEIEHKNSYQLFVKPLMKMLEYNHKRGLIYKGNLVEINNRLKNKQSIKKEIHMNNVIYHQKQ